MMVLASGMTRSQAESSRGLPSERALGNPRRRRWRTTSLQARFRGGGWHAERARDNINDAATVIVVAAGGRRTRPQTELGGVGTRSVQRDPLVTFHTGNLSCA